MQGEKGSVGLDGPSGPEGSLGDEVSVWTFIFLLAI